MSTADINLDVAALLLRGIVGITMILHGYNHGFGRAGIAGTARWFSSIGLRPPRVHAWISCLLEIAAGVGLLLGLLTPLAAAAVVGMMVVAWVANHRTKGFFVFKDGYEYVRMISVVCVALGVIGPGAVSLDNALGIVVTGFTGGLITLGVGVLGAAAVLVSCWRPASTSQ